MTTVYLYAARVCMCVFACVCRVCWLSRVGNANSRVKELHGGAPAGGSLLRHLPSLSLSFVRFLARLHRFFIRFQPSTRVIKYGDWGVDLARPAGQDLYLTQLPSYEYRDLVWFIEIGRVSRTIMGIALRSISSRVPRVSALSRVRGSSTNPA